MAFDPNSTNNVTVRRFYSVMSSLWAKIKAAIPLASSTTPSMDGTADAGSESTWARGDHVHPTDTSRAPTSHASSATTYGVGTTSNYGHVKLATGDMNGASNTDGVAVSKNHTHSQYVPTTRKVNGQALSADVTIATPGTLKTNATTAQTASSGEAMSGTITLHKVSKTGTYSDLIGKPTIPGGSSTTPLMDGTAAVGTETSWAHGDHVHPTDTSREAAANKKTTLNASSNTDFPTSKAVADFVNSSISTATAEFLGTYDVVADLGLTTSATNAQISTALGTHTWPSGVTPTNQDYVFVSVDDPGTTTDSAEYRRFKYNGSAWVYEYTLNNSSFTQAQWDAINSGVTATFVQNAVTGVKGSSESTYRTGQVNITKANIGLGNVANTNITVSATDGVKDVTNNVTYKYTHPTFTAVSAAAKKVGMNSEGHVVLGAALAKGDVGLGNVVNTGDSATPAEGGTDKFTTGGAYTELAKKADNENAVYYVIGTNSYAAYSSSSTYTQTTSSGPFDNTNSCIYSDYAYYCSTTISTPENWTSGHWTKIPTAVWAGTNSSITSLYAGLKIAYKVPSFGGSSVTQLNLNGLGAKTVYRGTGNTTTHLPKNSIVFLAYDGNYWRWADYNSTDGWATTIGAHCDTAAETAAKSATSSNTVLTAGMAFLTRFTKTNTAANKLTFNLNSQGAKDIWINGAVSSASNYNIPAGEHWTYYDGSKFYVWTDGTVHFKGLHLDTPLADTEIASAANWNAKADDSDVVHIAGTETITGEKTFSANAVFSSVHRDTYYASNVCRYFRNNGHPTNIAIWSKIEFANQSSMPVIRLYGYAYQQSVPFELTVAFYIYQDKFYKYGITSTGGFKTTCYLWKYTGEDNKNYVALGLQVDSEASYFLGFQVDTQVGSVGSFTQKINPYGWTVTDNNADNTSSIIPAIGTDKCVQITYKSLATDISGNAATATKPKSVLLTSSDDLNDFRGSGLGDILTYHWSSASCPAHNPNDGKSFVMQVINNASTNYVKQIAYLGANNRIYERAYIGDSWTEWQEFLFTGNVTSTYSSTGTDPVNGTAVAAALGTLDAASAGGDGKYIKAISETNGKISATAETMDTTPTASSTKAVTSGGVKTALDSKVSSITKNDTTITPTNGVANIGYIPTTYPAETGTVQEIIQALRVRPGGSQGSVDVKASTISTVSVPANWYNYIWLPHRTGNASGDNQNYGTLILTPLTGTPKVYVIEGQSLHNESPTYRAKILADSDHVHGNIQTAGALQTTDVTIASGDKLVITDASDSNKVARASAAFDGSTTSKVLTQKGTFESISGITPVQYYLPSGTKNTGSGFDITRAESVLQSCQTSFSDWNVFTLLYDVTEFCDGTIVNQSAEHSYFIGTIMSRRIGGAPGTNQAMISAHVGYSNPITTTGYCVLRSSNSSSVNPVLIKSDIERITDWNTGLYTFTVGETPILDTSLSGANYGEIACTEGQTVYISTHTGSSYTAYKAWAFVNSSNKVISVCDTFRYNGEMEAPAGATKLIVQIKSNYAAYSVNGVKSESPKYYLGVQFVSWTSALLTFFGSWKTRTTASTSFAARPLLMTHLSNIGAQDSRVIPPGYTIIKNSKRNIDADTTDKLTTARQLAVSLSNTTTNTTFNGTADVTNIKTTGTLGIANGGTGATTKKAAEFAICGNMQQATAAMQDNYQIVFSQVGSAQSATNGVFLYRTVSTVWDYFKEKIKADSHCLDSDDAIDIWNSI